MFRARDSCGADVRRGRSPKCLFIKATATGNTINGLNDEINKLPKAGHGGHGRASTGQGATSGQSPKPASQPGPSPAPAALPAPPRPSLAPVPPPTHTRPCPTATLGHMAHIAAPPGHSPRYDTLARAVFSPPQGGPFWAPALPEPPKCAMLVPNLECLVFLVVGGFFGSRRPDVGPKPSPPCGPGKPLEVAEGRRFPHAHPLLGLSVQFPVSGKLCFPWVTDD